MTFIPLPISYNLKKGNKRQKLYPMLRKTNRSDIDKKRKIDQSK